MMGPVAAGWAGLCFAPAGTTPSSHPGSGPFERPSTNPAAPAARIADTIKKAPNGRLIANLPPSVPSQRVESGRRLRARRTSSALPQVSSEQIADRLHAHADVKPPNTFLS